MENQKLSMKMTTRQRRISKSYAKETVGERREWKSEDGVSGTNREQYLKKECFWWYLDSWQVQIDEAEQVLWFGEEESVQISI